MSTTITTAFIDMFSAETKLAYQRMGAKLRGSTRVVNNVNALTYRFPKLGAGTANTKGRHADVVPMNLAHSNVTATLSDHYAPEYIDVLDEFKTNESVRSDYAESAAAAIGRQEDQIVIDALDAGNGSTEVAAATDLTLDKILSVNETLNEADVPQDPNERFFVIAPSQETQLMTMEGGSGNHLVYSNSEISGGTPFMRGAARFQWMGFTWIVHTGLPLSGSTRSCFAYHKRAIGLAIGKDITASIDWVPQKQSHLVLAKMSMGAIVIEGDGVIQVDCVES